jgi:hypothetical protein
MVLRDGLDRFRNIRHTTTWIVVKWALMSATIFWTLVYRLAAEAGKFPEFVYANF